MGKFKRYREESRSAWGTDTDGNITDDQIQLGAILRIADATESMAKNHQQLIDERDRFKRWYIEEQNRANRLSARISAYRGVITRLNNKLKGKAK